MISYVYIHKEVLIFFFGVSKQRVAFHKMFLYVRWTHSILDIQMPIPKLDLRMEATGTQ